MEQITLEVVICFLLYAAWDIYSAGHNLEVCTDKQLSVRSGLAGAFITAVWFTLADIVATLLENYS